MTYKVRWNLFVVAKSRDSVDKILDRVAAKFDMPLTLIEAERYWKDRRLFRVSVMTDHPAISPESAALDIQAAASQLASSWVTRGASVYDDVELEYEATATQDAIRLPGVEFATLSVQPLAVAQTGETQGSLVGF